MYIVVFIPVNFPPHGGIHYLSVGVRSVPSQVSDPMWTSLGYSVVFRNLDNIFTSTYNPSNIRV